MSSSVAERELPRRRLTERQAVTVERLAEAAVDEVRAAGYEGLTVRNVARRAGVAPATAYTYFASKDHLLAEVFWRRLHDLPEPRVDRRRGAAGRVTAALEEMAMLVAREPELAAAWTTAMLGTDPDVAHLRTRIGAEIRERLTLALGADAHRTVLQAVELALTGAMVQAGMGHLPYEELPVRLGEVVDVVVAGRGGS